MTPAEENALIVKVLADSGYQPDHDLDAAGILTIARLAIRAAVALERERAAKVCEEMMRVEPGIVQTIGNCANGHDCAAAIRRGE